MTSTPAWPSSKKPKNIMERFSEVPKIEEETAQKQHKLKKFQVKSTNEVAVASIQAKMHLRVERDQRKAELMMQKSKQDHEFCMAQLQTGNPTLTPPLQPNWLTGPQGSTSTVRGSKFAFGNDHNQGSVARAVQWGQHSLTLI